MWHSIFQWFLNAIPVLIVLGGSLLIPAVRNYVGKYFAGLAQHQFDEKIEVLKSELREREIKFASEIKANQQQISTLADTALNIRSTRQVAIDTRRLAAVDNIWKAKIASDRWLFLTSIMSSLNLEEIFKGGGVDTKVSEELAKTMADSFGIDLNNIQNVLHEMSAQSEEPYLSPNAYKYFNAYQAVITNSIFMLSAMAAGGGGLLKQKDHLKPLMLLALPEHKEYIEKYGRRGYPNLLRYISDKLLNEIKKTIDGKSLDETALRATSEIMAEVQKFNAQANSAVVEAKVAEKKIKLPEGLKEYKGPEIPQP